MDAAQLKRVCEIEGIEVTADDKNEMIDAILNTPHMPDGRCDEIIELPQWPNEQWQLKTIIGHQGTHGAGHYNLCIDMNKDTTV